MPTKPKLGQNFLDDAQAVERIVAALGDISGRTVIEIGPGGGAITGTLAARARHVVAVELDHDLAVQLRVQFSPSAATIRSTACASSRKFCPSLGLVGMDSLDGR